MRALRAAVWRRRLDAAGALAPLREYQRWLAQPVEAVRAEQRRRLTSTLLHAYEHVPYYRQTLAEAGVVRAGEGGTSVDLDAFSRLPPLDKPALRERFDDLRADDGEPRGAYVTSTGGSTGEPVRFVHDRGSHAVKVANRALYDTFAGYRTGEASAVLWGAVGDITARSLRAQLGVWLRNELRLEAFQMSEERMDEYVARLNAFRPRFLLAYAQSAYELAAHAERRGLEVLPIPSIMTSATNLEPHMRSTIERVFAARVYDRYGSREVGAIACENGDGLGLISNPLTHVVEAVDESGRPVPAGETGELLVTTLFNRSMPLIRYRIGDAGALGEPAGDVPWPRVTEVSGRVTDIFYTRRGARVYGGYFTRQFYDRPWVAQFQVVQEDYDHLRVLLVPRNGVDPSFVESEKRALAQKFCNAMGDECRVDFDMVGAIEVGPTGKRRYTVSRVGPPA